MSDVVLEHLGKAVPGEHGQPPEHLDKIATSPIVLWRGSTLAAAFYYRWQSRALGRSGEQRIERLDDGGHGSVGSGPGPFPLVFGTPFLPSGETLDDATSFDDLNMATGDVNGDGVDELILPRKNGAIAVYGIDKVLFQQWAPTAPQGMYYHVDDKLVAKLPGHDVFFILLTLWQGDGKVQANEAALAKAERHILYRIDQKGIARVPLPPSVANVQDITAIGALHRPGATDVDEILLLVRDDQDEAFLSRHRPDGSAIAAPKEFYVQLTDSSPRFLFLAGTPQAILASGQHVLFLRPEKASNWIADVDLTPLAGSPHDLEILQATDPGVDPKVKLGVLVRKTAGPPQGPIGADLYAVNREGKCFRAAPAGEGWQPLSARSPYLQTRRPSEQHKFLGLRAQPGADIVLAVYTREAQLKELSDDEVMKAAERFLQPEVIAGARRINRVEFGIEALEEAPNHSNEERIKRGVTEEIKSVEQWKRLLPDSYAEVLAFRMDGVRVDLRVDLESGAKRPIDPEKYQNIEEYKAWLAALHVGPETVFEITRRGEMVARFQIAAFLPSDFNDDFRTGATGASLVLPLDVTPSVGAAKQPLGFYLVQLNRKIF